MGARIQAPRRSLWTYPAGPERREQGVFAPFREMVEEVDAIGGSDGIISVEIETSGERIELVTNALFRRVVMHGRELLAILISIDGARCCFH